MVRDVLPPFWSSLHRKSIADLVILVNVKLSIELIVAAVRIAAQNFEGVGCLVVGEARLLNREQFCEMDLVLILLVHFDFEATLRAGRSSEGQSATRKPSRFVWTNVLHITESARSRG